jgi:hypothetical protein
MRKNHSVRCAGVLALALCLSSVGRAETTQCTAITRLPATISSEGIYCLASDFFISMLSGNAVTIEADNVALDLNGRTIDNRSAGSGNSAVGIMASERRNITIKNGTIRGFSKGVLIGDYPPFTRSQGHLVEHLHVVQNSHAGIVVTGRGNVVRHNRILETGGTVVYENAYGIVAVGHGARIVDNDVMVVTPPESGYPCGIAFAYESDNGIALRNRVTDASYGIVMEESSVKYRDNITTGVPNPFVGGTDAGNNSGT